MLIEGTKLLTGGPQARRFAAMCTSGCKQPSTSHSFDAYMKPEWRHNYKTPERSGLGVRVLLKIVEWGFYISSW